MLREGISMKPAIYLVWGLIPLFGDYADQVDACVFVREHVLVNTYLSRMLFQVLSRPLHLLFAKSPEPVNG
jgi:hypothetical protein